MYIVDGYNLIFTMAETRRAVLARDPGEARQSLCARLADFSRRTTKKCIVYFDACDPPPGLPRHRIVEGVDVRMPEKTQTADDAIIEYVRQHANPRSLTVVSSDRGVLRAILRHKANKMTSRQFAVRLASIHDRLHDPAIRYQGVREHDVEAWMQYFGFGHDKETDGMRRNHPDPHA